LATCRSGGIGRRKGLKIPRAHKARAGSIPASGTIMVKSHSLHVTLVFLPMKSTYPSRRMLRCRSACALVTLLFCVGCFVTLSPAQTSPTPANPQNPSTQSLQAGVDTSSSAVATTTLGTTQSLTAIQGVASIPSSSRPGSLRSAGQGLPGMPGGPPIKGSLGYQDPASSYMRPRTIGPLLCDPLVDGVCD
jgi:hypothetical protein